MYDKELLHHLVTKITFEVKESGYSWTVEWRNIPRVGDIVIMERNKKLQVYAVVWLDGEFVTVYLREF